MALLASSLIDGFAKSNFMGQGIVLAQLAGSVLMVAAVIGKWRTLLAYAHATRRFLRDFSTCGDVLEYYLQRRPNVRTGVEGIYKETCERLLKLLTPDVRSLLVGRQSEGAAALTAREIELVRGTCEHVLDEEEIRIGYGMGLISTVVALAPMLGLLGTVWGVLDAFAEMGAAGSANLATIAPSISAALVTTVVGLLVAIPGMAAFTRLNALIRAISADMEGFADELIGRIAWINMNSLIDLTFILLVVFIVTLPTLEQSIHVLLPVGKTEKAQNDKKKNFSITVDSVGKLFIGEAPVTMEDLKARLAKAVADDPDVSVLVRGDVRVGYGDVYEVVKVAKDANVRHLGLVSKEN